VREREQRSLRSKYLRGSHLTPLSVSVSALNVFSSAHMMEDVQVRAKADKEYPVRRENKPAHHLCIYVSLHGSCTLSHSL
jgi:hypothetical protein